MKVENPKGKIRFTGVGRALRCAPFQNSGFARGAHGVPALPGGDPAIPNHSIVGDDIFCHRWTQMSTDEGRNPKGKLRFTGVGRALRCAPFQNSGSGSVRGAHGVPALPGGDPVIPNHSIVGDDFFCHRWTQMSTDEGRNPNGKLRFTGVGRALRARRFRIRDYCTRRARSARPTWRRSCNTKSFHCRR